VPEGADAVCVGSGVETPAGFRGGAPDANAQQAHRLLVARGGAKESLFQSGAERLF